MPHEAAKLLADARESVELILSYVEGLSFEDYLAQPQARDAVERRFTVIGEALGRLKKLDPERHARIRYTAEITAFRNIIVHVYDQLDHNIVWRIIHENLPDLREDLAD